LNQKYFNLGAMPAEHAELQTASYGAGQAKLQTASNGASTKNLTLNILMGG